MSPTPILIDCDPGHDDAIALLLALASPEVELLGVTTVHGNQTLEKTTANALRVLELAGRIAEIVLMGGAIAEGNMTPAAEFNIWADPEAAQAVFHSGIDVAMVGLDVTHQALLTGADAERLRSTGRIGAFVADLVEFFKRYHQETYGWAGAPIHDAVAVAELIRPGLVTTRLRNVEVETVSELCRGRTVVDLWQRTGREANARVGVGIDAEGFFRLLTERIATLG
jgi:inosine-uridine nucleoside N-ribohydrolase